MSTWTSIILSDITKSIKREKIIESGGFSCFITLKNQNAGLPYDKYNLCQSTSKIETCLNLNPWITLIRGRFKVILRVKIKL